MQTYKIQIKVKIRSLIRKMEKKRIKIIMTFLKAIKNLNIVDKVKEVRKIKKKKNNKKRKN